MKIFIICMFYSIFYLAFTIIFIHFTLSSEEVPSLKDYPPSDTLIPISNTDVIIDDMLQAYVYYTNTEIYQKTEEPCQTLMTYRVTKKDDCILKYNRNIDKTCSCYSQEMKAFSKSGYCYSSYTKQQIKCDSYPKGFITLEYAENNCGYNDSDSNIKAPQTNCYGYSQAENKAYLLDISGTVIMKEVDIKPLRDIQEQLNQLQQLSFCREDEDATYPIPEKSILYYKNDNNQYITENRHYAFQKFKNLVYYASKFITRKTEKNFTTVRTFDIDYETSGLQVNGDTTTVVPSCRLKVGFYKYTYLSEKCPDVIKQDRIPFNIIPTNEFNMYVKYEGSTRVYSVINKLTSWDIIGYEKNADNSTRYYPEMIYFFVLLVLFVL